MRAALERSQVTMIVLRERRSATTPPTGAAKIGGTRRSTSTATAVWFPPLTANAAAMNARVATQSPSEDTAWPTTRRRKPGARRAARKPPAVVRSGRISSGTWSIMAEPPAAR